MIQAMHFQQKGRLDLIVRKDLSKIDQIETTTSGEPILQGLRVRGNGTSTVDIIIYLIFVISSQIFCKLLYFRDIER